MPDHVVELPGDSGSLLGHREACLLRDRTQAVAGLAFGIGVTAIIAHNGPNGGGVAGFALTCVVFTVAWSIGFVLGHKFREADEARERLACASTGSQARAFL